MSDEIDEIDQIDERLALAGCRITIVHGENSMVRTSRSIGKPSRRMLKMASQQGRRELGDRSVPLRYVVGRRATENDAGGHFQHPARAGRGT